MGNGTEENPYTREDVLRLIQKNKGTADGLDLTGKVFEKCIDLKNFNLRGIILNEAIFLFDYKKWDGAHLERAELRFANLNGVHLHYAHLEEAGLIDTYLEGARLWSVHFEGAKLYSTRLKGADLRKSYFEGASIFSVEFPDDTRLEDVYWGNYILWQEKKAEEHDEEFKKSIGEGWFADAAATYRRLKIWHTNHGIYDIAGKFFYREMEAKRKALYWKREPHLKLWIWAMRMICGYGEKPERVVIWAAFVVFGLAVAYYFWGSFSSSSFSDTLYYSVTSFTAVGYGNWVPQPIGWAKGMGAAEAFIGVFTMALFLVTFTRKMTR